MKRIQLVGLVSLTVLACTHRGAPPPNAPPAPGSQDQSGAPLDATTIAAQEAVNRYFHAAVTPKLRTCWDRVQGEGTIELALTYVRSEGGWMLESVAALRSDLPEEQRAAAVRCMQESARGTSFTLGGDEGSRNAGKLVLKWVWLVPLPAEGSDVMARRAGEMDTPQGCAKCIANYPARCQWSSSGEADCRVDGPTQCSTSGTKCLSGIYGRAGGSIITF